MNFINITTIVNTGYVMQNYKNPSQDYKNPTPIDHNSEYMVATFGTAISGTATADLVVQAEEGDMVRWFGISESNNFDSAIIMYNAVAFNNQTKNGKPVFKTPEFTEMDNDTMVPDSDYPSTAATEQTVPAWFLQATVDEYGSSNYWLQFALYTKNNDNTMQLYGYFAWDPMVQVNQPVHS